MKYKRTLTTKVSKQKLIKCAADLLSLENVKRERERSMQLSRLCHPSEPIES